MADLTFTIPNEFVTEIINAICEVHNYEGTHLEAETKIAFAKRQIGIHLKLHIKNIWTQYQIIQSTIDWDGIK